MSIDQVTPNLGLPLPDPGNLLDYDVFKLRDALIALDQALGGKQALLGYTPENSANKGTAGGYAGLDGTGKVPALQLPGFVDDVIEVANWSSLPVIGESGKIYVTLASVTVSGTLYAANKQYRWSGSGYVEINPSPGSTDGLVEGSTNRYFTEARALAAVPQMSSNVAGIAKLGAGLGIDAQGRLYAAIGAGSTMDIVDITPTDGASSVTVIGGYVAGCIMVAVNGHLLDQADYTATNGTSIGFIGFTLGVSDTVKVIRLSTIVLGNLPAGTVGATQLADGAVTPAKLATGAALANIGNTAVPNAVSAGSATNATNVVAGGAIASDVTGTTQTAGDNSTKLATTAYADRAASTLVNVQTFDVSGTWTKPTGGQRMAYIQIWGGGGGGARGPYNGYYGPGGGSGGDYIEAIVPLSYLGSTVPITVGAGGAGATTYNTPGGNGGNSSVPLTTAFCGLNTLIATGGGGGGDVYLVNDTPSSGGHWLGGRHGGSSVFGGGGGNNGSSVFGGDGGSLATSPGVSGGAGAAPGGGGGSSFQGLQINVGNGGNGAAGRVIITAY